MLTIDRYSDLLAIEQDLVHRPSAGRVSHAPNSDLKSGPTDSSSSMAKLAFSPPSTVTSNSWQTNSKQQTATFQSELSTVGSPLLHSLWHKKARADAAANNATRHGGAGGISFEQKKIHYYDDYMTDLEKQQDFSPGLSTVASSNGSPMNERNANGADYERPRNTFIIANPDTPNSPQVYQMSNDSNNMMMTTPLKKSSSPVESTYTDYIDSPSTVKRPGTSGTVTGGVSIRSIRANMESSASVDGAMNLSPLKNFHRPSTSPVVASKSPLTPLSEARKRVSRMFDAWQPAPTFEISPGKGVSGSPRAIIDPAQIIATTTTTTPHRQQGDLPSLNHSASKASISSIATFTSQSALRPTVQKTGPSPPRQRSNNLSNTSMDREPTTSFDVNRSDISGGDGFSNSTFGRQTRPQRLGSLEIDDDPFRS